MNHSNSSLKQLCALALLAFLLAGFQFPDNSLLQGLKKAFYENGQMESEKHYKNGVLNGPAQCTGLSEDICGQDEKHDGRKNTKK